MKDQIVNTNTRQFKEAVVDILYTYSKHDPQNLTWKDIKITDNGALISIRGEPFLRYDRHHHYVKEKDHLAALFFLLECGKRTCNLSEYG